MADDVHMYDVVGSQGGGHRLSERSRVTCFDDKQEYMSLHGPQQEGSSEYQEPQWCARNTTAAVSSDGSSDCHVRKDELKQMKRCLCVLSLLVVILFLTTILSLSLAAYGFSSIRSSVTVINLEYQLNTINSELVSYRTLVNALESQFNTTNAEVISQRTLTDTLESQFNAINAEVSSQRTSINTLNSQLNETDSEISTVRSSVASLQSQLTNSTLLINANVSSLQIALRSQPRK